MFRRWARRTWHFFDTFVNAETHWLPPDNVQWDIDVHQAFDPDHTRLGQPGKADVPFERSTVAPRTSPTNIGLGLLADLAAYDLGYLSASRLLERAGHTLETMVKLECHRGHFYNWYDIDTLEPAGPRYVSTVDSGNLRGALLVMQAGLAELRDRPLVGPRFAQGFQDTLDVLTEIEARSASDGDASVREHEYCLSRLRVGLPCVRGARTAMQFVDQLAIAAADLERGHYALRDTYSSEWIVALARQSAAARQEFARLAFWLGDDGGEILVASLAALIASAETPHEARAAAANLLALIERADENCTLRELPEMAEEAVRLATRLDTALEVVGRDQRACERRPTMPVERLAALVRRAEQAAAAARDQLAEIDRLAELCRDFSTMDFRFLYNSQRKLLAIGYNVLERRRDASCYDLLASEARLASFLAISDGQLPPDHWTALGRSVALHGGVPALLSWSGSMFEYLMPVLVMPSYPTTLLDASCRAAVARQIRYAREQGRPWGVSESCYDRRNDDGAYSYRAFGVPGLRLERRTDRSMVVAPYASALAAMVAPSVACENLSRLEGLGALCSYGFYDALDYTTAGGVEHPAACRTVMAHHSGMALVAFANILLDAPMRRRLMSDPRLRAHDLLLQQRMPQAVRPVDWRSREEAARLLARVDAAVPAASVLHPPQNAIDSVPYAHA